MKCNLPLQCCCSSSMFGSEYKKNPLSLFSLQFEESLTFFYVFVFNSSRLIRFKCGKKKLLTELLFDKNFDIIDSREIFYKIII